jgi:hypothetical protein
MGRRCSAETFGLSASPHAAPVSRPPVGPGRRRQSPATAAPHLGPPPFALCRTHISNSQNLLCCDAWRVVHIPRHPLTWPRRCFGIASGLFLPTASSHQPRADDRGCIAIAQTRPIAASYPRAAPGRINRCTGRGSDCQRLRFQPVRNLDRRVLIDGLTRPDSGPLVAFGGRSSPSIRTPRLRSGGMFWRLFCNSSWVSS